MDWNKAYLLLHVAEQAFGHPTLKALHAEALKELQQMSEKIAADEAEEAEPKAKVEAKVERR